MVVLDSSIWIAYLNSNDLRHAKATDLYDSLKDDILVPEYILSEICSVLASKKEKERANHFITIAENNEHIELLPSTPQFFSEVRTHFRGIQSSRLLFVDVALIVISRSFRVYTFDATLYRYLKNRTMH